MVSLESLAVTMGVLPIATLLVTGLALLPSVSYVQARWPSTRTLTASSAVVSATTSPVISVKLNGQTYVNKGLVGFGLIPSNFRESTGDTLGGIGSAMAIKYGTWKATKTGFEGTLVVHPDRGYNVYAPPLHL